MSNIVNEVGQLAIFWEDLPVGTKYLTSSRTIMSSCRGMPLARGSI